MTDSPALADAWVLATGDAWTLIFVRDLPHPPGVVWRALTDPAELAQWAPFDADRDLGAPGEVTLTMVDGASRMPLTTTVLEVKEPELLAYAWGADLLQWELTAIDGGTRLTLRHTLADRGMDAMVAAGWHLCVAVLERLLAGEPVGVIRGQDALNYGWEQLRDGYAEKFAG